MGLGLLSRNWKIWIVDSILHCSVLLPLLAAVFGFIPPYGGNFNCEDTSIRFPYTGDTIKTKILVMLIIFPVAVLIFITEFFHSQHVGWIATFKFGAGSACSVLTRYWFALLGNASLNLALKTMLAIPRPHFIDTCNPNWDLVNCSQNAGQIKFSLTLCQNSKNVSAHKDIYDAMKSFPSGHAQLSCFAAAFAIVYISYRVGTSYSKLWKYWLQLVMCLFSAFISISRLNDHRHHLADVVAGAVIGSVLGIMAAKSLKFKEFQTKNSPMTPKKEKRPSQMRLIHPEFSYGAVVDIERNSSEVNLNPGC